MPGRRLLVVSERDHQVLEIDQMPGLSIGRAPENDLVLKDDMVSRRHCQIDRAASGEIRVRDLKSFNGTYLNERRIREEPMQPWDAVRVGRTRLILLDPSQEPPGRRPAGAPDQNGGAPPAREDGVAAGPGSVENMGATRTLMAGGDLAEVISDPTLRGALEEMVRRERESVERELVRRVRDESAPGVLPTPAQLDVRVRRWGPLDGGGDFYDVFSAPPPLRPVEGVGSPGETCVCVGSVSGVGIAASLQASSARHTLRGLLSRGDLGVREAVQATREVLTQTLHPGSAISLLLARFRDDGEVVLAATGGAGALHFVAARRVTDVLRAPGRRDEEAPRVEELAVRLGPGDRLVLASDGAGSLRGAPGDGEPGAAPGEPFGPDRLREAVQAAAAEAPKETVSRALDFLKTFAGGAPDRDVTLLVAARA